MFQGIVKFLELIKFSHTIFALPFALISMLLATNGKTGWMVTLWIILAMAGARTGAMGFNRLVDKKFDAENPRTAKRPSVTGEVPASVSIFMILISFALLVFASWKLNPMAFKLSPVAIFLVCFYSYAKRFTSLAHIFLGIAIGSAPIAAWIAVTGEISLISLIIGGSVLTWMAGFDILYALQDYEFDKQAGLHSIPVRFGVSGSLWIARTMHLITVILWVTLHVQAQTGLFFLAGIILATIALIYENALVKKDDLSKINMAFFNMNAVISVTLLVAMLADLYLPSFL